MCNMSRRWVDSSQRTSYIDMTAIQSDSVGCAVKGLSRRSVSECKSTVERNLILLCVPYSIIASFTWRRAMRSLSSMPFSVRASVLRNEASRSMLVPFKMNPRPTIAVILPRLRSVRIRMPRDEASSFRLVSTPTSGSLIHYIHRRRTQRRFKLVPVPAWSDSINYIKSRSTGLPPSTLLLSGVLPRW